MLITFSLGWQNTKQLSHPSILSRHNAAAEGVWLSTDIKMRRLHPDTSSTTTLNGCKDAKTREPGGGSANMDLDKVSVLVQIKHDFLAMSFREAISSYSTQVPSE